MEDLKGRQLGGYQILEQIGKGGMASVFRAYQPSLDRDVAIKVLPPYYAEQDETFTQRFKREAKAIANLRHPNILMVMEAGEQDGLAYLVMEYVTAGTLKERLQKPISLKEIYSLVQQIASALEHAHERGIVHRDIKPSNIMLPKPDWALLTDFGLAHMVGGSMLTQSGMTVGTPAYMSPEQGRGERVDHRTDIYSLGVMLYEMTVGEVPYTAETPMAVVVKHIVDPLPIPRDKNPNIPEDLQRVILKALAKNPDDRFQSVGEMVAALERVAVSHPDWSAAEMKAVNAVRGLQDNPPETHNLEDWQLAQNMTNDPTVLPPAGTAAPPPVDSEPSPISASGAAARKPKKKLRWLLWVGGIFLFLVCALIGIGMLQNILGATPENNESPVTTDEGLPLEEPLIEENPGTDLDADENELLMQGFNQIGELVAEGDTEEAKQVFSNLKKRFPQVWDLFMARRVQPLFEKGETEQAVLLLEAGLLANPGAPPESFEQAGFLFLELGRPEDALHAFERTILHHPWYYPAYLSLEYTAAEGRDLIPKGIQILEKINEQYKEAVLYHTLGNLYAYNGQDTLAYSHYQEAKDRYREAIANDSQNPWNMYGLAAVLFYADEDLEAIPELLSKAERLGFEGKNDRLLDKLAWLYYEMDDCPNTNRILNTMADKLPGYVKSPELQRVCP